MTEKKVKKSSRKKILVYYIIIFLVLSISGVGGLYFYLGELSKDLPQFDQLEKFEPSYITKVYSSDDVLLKEFYQVRRNPVDLDSIPEHVIHALLSTEDRQFFTHWGFNTLATMRAMILNVPRVLSGGRPHGASTITQQLARNLYQEIGFKHSYERKIKELLTSINLESMYSKKELLEMYLTQSTFGPNVYGIQAGAKYFFGKNASELDVDEAALLVAQLKAPAHYNPYRKPERALNRRNLVLHNMLVCDYITEADYKYYTNKPIVLTDKQREDLGIAPYFTEYVRQQLNDVNKEYKVDYLNDGLTIYTTIDSRAQKIAEEAIAKNLPELTQRTIDKFFNPYNSGGFKDYLKRKYPGDDNKEKREAAWKDSTLIDSLSQHKLTPEVALVAMNPTTGEILAMIGGTDFTVTKFNRAVQAWRQPGSIFKPVLYLTAIDNGNPPSLELLNQNVVKILDDKGKRWTPQNYGKKVGGLTTLRDALLQSLNLISVRLIQEIVTPREVVSYAKKLGIDTRHVPPVDAIALGAGEVLPIDILTAYSTIANKGTKVEPYSISKVLNIKGDTILENTPKRSVAISEETSYIITDMMREIVDNPRGTGYRLRATYKFERPTAGKTGTTNDFTDAWFCGFTPQIAVVVWVGLDDRYYKLGPGSTGGNTALPIWADFIKNYYEGTELPEVDFEMPDGVIEVEICEESKKAAGPYCPKSYKELFNRKYYIHQGCDIHTGGIIEDDDNDLRRSRY